VPDFVIKALDHFNECVVLVPVAVLDFPDQFLTDPSQLRAGFKGGVVSGGIVLVMHLYRCPLFEFARTLAQQATGNNKLLDLLCALKDVENL
jgi:hypothetical protein